MGPHERRQSIWRTLCQRRQDTIENLAAEYKVSLRTIRYDVEILSLSYPLESVRGRYGGGVRVSDWYHPNQNTLCPTQMLLLKKLALTLEDDDLAVLNSIISQFGPR